MARKKTVKTPTEKVCCLCDVKGAVVCQKHCSNIFEYVLEQKTWWEIRRMYYDKYMASEDWKTKARTFYEMAGHECECCGAAHVKIGCHHMGYDALTKETFDDVLVLCDRCHERIHKLTEDKQRIAYKGILRLRDQVKLNEIICEVVK